MFLWSKRDDRVAIVQLNAELRHAQLEMLSAKCATDRLRLRFSAEDVARYGERDLLQKAVASATALHDYYSAIARQVSDANSSAQPRAFSLQDEKVLAAIDHVRQYLQEQRTKYQSQGVPLGPDQHTRMKPFFPLALLTGIRIVELRNQRIPNPPFYAEAKALGLTNLPELTHMDSLTFEDVVIFPNEINDRHLFHGLVHAVQFKVLGARALRRAFGTGLLANPHPRERAPGNARIQPRVEIRRESEQAFLRRGNGETLDQPGSLLRLLEQFSVPGSQWTTGNVVLVLSEKRDLLSTVPYVHDIPILHNVVLAFEPQRAFGSGVGFGTRFQQLIPANRFGADEVLFQIGVNRAGAVLRSRIQRDRPGAAFVFAGGEKRNQSQQVIALADQARESAFGQSIAAEKFRRVFVAHLRQFRFHFAADRARPGIRTRRHFRSSLYFATAASRSLPSCVLSPMLST